MRSFTLIALLASVAQAYDAKELPSTATDENDSQDSMGTDNFIQKLVDKLVDQANQQFQNADMDATTLAQTTLSRSWWTSWWTRRINNFKMPTWMPPRLQS